VESGRIPNRGEHSSQPPTARLGERPDFDEWVDTVNVVLNARRRAGNGAETKGIATRACQLVRALLRRSA